MLASSFLEACFSFRFSGIGSTFYVNGRRLARKSSDKCASTWPRHPPTALQFDQTSQLSKLLNRTSGKRDQAKVPYLDFSG